MEEDFVLGSYGQKIPVTSIEAGRKLAEHYRAYVEEHYNQPKKESHGNTTDRRL